MKSLAKQFNHDFEKGEFKLYDEKGNETYYENSKGYESGTPRESTKRD